jgi:hypothetical protein
VRSVGTAIAEHVRAHGSLPASLTELNAFPKSAQERDADALKQPPGASLEFFYFKMPPSDFTLIGRNSGETWIYQPGQADPVRRLP